MKKILFIPFFLLCISIISCNKEVPVSANSNESSPEFILAGKPSSQADPNTPAACNVWAISSFIKFEVDETWQYRPLNFEFCPDNTLTVWNDVLSYKGNWYIMLDKGNPWYLTLDFDFNLDETTGKLAHYWADLEGNWKIIKMIDTIIQLQNDDGTKYLTFVKRSK